jgi:hypothetical protein
MNGMKLSEKDELLIQRCVDGELSPADTRNLLRRLDNIDSGWKTLACGLLEDRTLRKFSKSPDAFRIPATASKPEKAVDGNASTSRSKSQNARHWWSHPVTSLTLCAAIAFVGGMLIPEFGGQSPSPSYANNNGAVSRQPVAMSAGTDRGPYHVDFSPNDGNSAVPVYSTIDDLTRHHRNHPLNPDFSGQKDSLEWIVVPYGSDKSMLFPIRSDGVQVPLQ